MQMSPIARGYSRNVVGVSHCLVVIPISSITLRPRQNGCHFTDYSFKHIFLNENIWISTKIWLKLIPKGPINNIPTLVQMRAWHWPDDKPLSEPVMVWLPMHIWVTRHQWVMLPNKFLAFSMRVLGTLEKVNNSHQPEWDWASQSYLDFTTKNIFSDIWSLVIKYYARETVPTWRNTSFFISQQICSKLGM